MTCKVKLYRSLDLHTKYYQNWLQDITTFLNSIGMDRGTAKIRTWEYGVPLQDVVLFPTDICLDTGSYNTYIGAYLAQSVKQMWLTDSFEWGEREYVRRLARPTPPQWRIAIEKASKNIATKEVDIREIPFENDHFNNIFSFSTIEHVPEDTKAIRELWRVLKPGGQLLLTTDISKQGRAYRDYGKIYNVGGIRNLFSYIEIELPEFEIPDELLYEDFTCISIYIRK